MNLYGGKPLAVNRNFEVCGVRGQDYFVLDSSSKNINLQKIPVESGPRPIAVIKIDPLDRIWVASPIGSTIFSVDLSNQIITEISDIGRQVGDLSFFNDKIYAVSYTGGDITEYNPAIEWDKLYGTNPRLIAKVGPAYIRPTGGVVTGLNGLLYSGWMARYNIYGGALAITNLLDNGKTEILENPLGQQAISGVAVDEDFIYLGTSLRGNGLPIKRGESAQIGVFDITTKSVIFQLSFDRAIEVTSIICNPELNLVAMLVMGRLHIFNPNNQEFVKNPILDSFSVTSRSIAFTSKSDSLIYYGVENSLFTISPETLKTKKILEMSTPISHIRLDKNENVYIVCRAEIFKLDNNFK